MARKLLCLHFRARANEVAANGGNTRYYIGNSGQQLWNKQLSEELRLTSDPGRRIDYQAGLYYLKARVHSDDPTYNGPDSGAFNASDAQFNRLIQTAGGKQLLVDSLNGIYQSEVTDAKVRSVAVYGQADWHITDKGTLTAGVRRTDEHKTNRFEQQLDRPGLPLTAENYPVPQGYTAQNLVDANAIRTARIRTPTGFIDGDPSTTASRRGRSVPATSSRPTFFCTRRQARA